MVLVAAMVIVEDHLFAMKEENGCSAVLLAGGITGAGRTITQCLLESVNLSTGSTQSYQVSDKMTSELATTTTNKTCTNTHRKHTNFFCN